MFISQLKRTAALGAIVAVIGLASVPAQAAEVITPVGVDLRDGDFTFTFLDSTFTFGTNGDIFNPLTVQTSDNAAVSSFGGFLGIPVNPTSFFTNRGTVQFGPDVFGSFASFSSETAVPFSNGENFLGLRATFEGQNYFGFAYTSGFTLNSIGFQTAPQTTITATTDISAAVPEPATWAMMLLGFFAVGGAMRRRSQQTSVAYSFA